MGSLSLKSLLTAAIIGLSPLITYADKASDFRTTCVNAWMARAVDVKDKVDYQNFGEQYCTCAAGQLLDTPAAVQKAAQICMSRTLLHDTMDYVENEIGLEDATPGDINEYCQDRWALIYPAMSADVKASTTEYCSCSNPKLLSLVKASSKLTDEAYYKEIDVIAAECSGKVKADSTTTEAAH